MTPILARTKLFKLAAIARKTLLAIGIKQNSLPPGSHLNQPNQSNSTKPHQYG